MNNFAEHWEEAGIKAREIALQLVWNQWSSLGSMARSTSFKNKNRVIDPESLVLTSVALQKEERRLTEVLAWWAHDGTGLLSVQRMKKMASKTRSNGKDLFSEYAQLAALCGHRSWNNYAEHENQPELLHNHQKDTRLELRGPENLLLRLRATFGVGAKADIMSFLVSTPQFSATVPEISKYLDFSNKAVRDALKDMNVAGLVRESSGRPASYSTNQLAWVDLMNSKRDNKTDHPEWALWSAIFPFLTSAMEICTAAVSSSLNSFLVNSYARDLIETYQYAFEFHQIELPDLAEYPGREFSAAFLQSINSLASWAK